MAPAKRVKARSPAQVKATQAWARSGRRKQAQARAASIAGTGKPPPRTKAQKAASQRFAAAGRAAQAARRAGKTPVTAKKAAAPGGTGLHELPVCGPAAVAEHLRIMTGAAVSDEAILELWRLAGAATIGGLLGAVAEHGLGGQRLAYYERCDPGCGAPYLLYGLQLDPGYHAVVAVPGGGMLSWGMLLPRTGTPEEAWWLEWEDT
jgi:hypothetical protein